MIESGILPADQRPAPALRCLAYGVHLYTASGLVCAALTAAAIAEAQYQLAFLWMAVAVVVDATDGVLARRLRVKQVLPHVDGARLDDIVDYLNYTFLPLLLLWHAGWLPDPAWLWVSIPLVASALAFCNTGAKDHDDGFFVGFPSYWNMFALYVAVMFPDSPYVVLVLALLLSVLSVLPVRFVYPNRAARWRPLFLGGGALWLGVLLALVWKYPDVPAWLLGVSLIYPVVYTALSVYLDFTSRAAQRAAREAGE